MNIHSYFLCYNEESILPHLLKYYLKFCSKITILDNQSTDSSVSIAKSFNNVDVITWDSGNEVRDDLYSHIKNNVWKGSRGSADLVIVGDADEFLYSENPYTFFRDRYSDGFSVFRPEGYFMIADEDYDLNTSSDLLSQVTQGIRGASNDKLMAFDPNKVQEINYYIGCHDARPVGNIKLYNSSELKMLHYKYLGLNDFIPKQLLRGKRLSKFNKDYNLGSHYLYTAEKHKQEYADFVSKRVKVI